MHFDKLYNIIFENENDLNLKNDLRNFKNNWEDRGVENFPIYMDKEIVLHELRIKKELRGRGIGSLYIDGLKEIANKYNLNISLEPSEQLGADSLERLKKFYANLGFKEVGTYMIYEPKKIVESKMTKQQEAFQLFKTVTMNPRKDDIEKILSRSIADPRFKTIRAIVHAGKIYVWEGRLVQHNEIIEAAKITGVFLDEDKNKPIICLLFDEFCLDGSVAAIKVTTTGQNKVGYEETKNIVKNACASLVENAFNFDNPRLYMDFNSIERRML